MRGFVSKFLRRDARGELSGETEADVNYFEERSGSIRVHPNTIRALYLKLKAAYRRMRSHGGTPRLLAQRRRKQHQHTGKQPQDRIVRIQKPLMFILEHCPPTKKIDPLTRDVVVVPHPIYRSARIAASRGRGDLVNKMAAQFLPA